MARARAPRRLSPAPSPAPTRAAVEAPVAGGTCHVALLRGVNVGGKNKLPMKDLVALFEAAGATQVASYIQSGNVVFRAPTARLAGLAERVRAAVAERFGFRPDMVLRSAAALAAAARDNPFVKAGADPDTIHVAFLSATPTAEQVASLDPDRSPPDRVEVRGDTAYLVLPSGVARTRITNAYLDARLGCVSTVRNLRTVEKLRELCAGG